MTDRYSLLLVFVMAAGTAVTRFLPFLLFPAGRRKPAWVTHLSNVLPAAAIAMLVVYCLKDIRFTVLDGFLPELIAVAAVVLLHVWKRQPLLSIGGGTLCYMLLVQQVF